MTRNKKLAVTLVVVAIAALCSTRANAQDDRAVARDRNPKQAERRQRESPPPQAQKPQERRPRPDGRYDRYDYRRYPERRLEERDRFPRYYPRVPYFRDRFYRHRAFGPHLPLVYIDGSAEFRFYWPYLSEPQRGCDWYYVPTHRWPYHNPRSRDQYWDYSEWKKLYLCFD